MKLNALTITTDIILISIAFALFIVSILFERSFVLMRLTFYSLFTFETDIEDIQLNRVTCDSGYEPLFNLEYYGLSRGCFSKSHNTFSKGSECHEDTSDEVSIPKISARKMSVYKDKLICVKRYDLDFWNKNFYNAPNGTNCKNGTRFCGFLNQYNDSICVNQTLSCPVTDILIGDEGNSKFKTYEKIQLSDGKYFLYTKEPSKEYVPVTFEISQGFPCVDKYQFRYTDDYYPLSERYDTLGCYNPLDVEDNSKKSNAHERLLSDSGGHGSTPNDKNSTSKRKEEELKYIDTRVIPMDTITKKELYINNDLYYEYEKLPLKEFFHYDPMWNNIYTLYKSYRITIKTSCFDLNDMYKEHRESTNIKIDSYVLLIVNIINLCLIVVFTSMKSIVKVSTKRGRLIVIIIKILLDAVAIILNFILDIHMINIQTSLFQLIRFRLHSCMDSVTYTIANSQSIFEQMDYCDIHQDTHLAFVISYLFFFIIQNAYFVYKTAFMNKHGSDEDGDIVELNRVNDEIKDKTFFESISR